MFAISKDEQIRGEVDQNLRIIAATVHALYKKTKGGTKIKKLNSRNRRFHIFEGQVLLVQELQKENNFMKDDIAEWRKSFANLQEEKEKLYQEMILAVQQREQEISNLHAATKQGINELHRMPGKEGKPSE